MSTHYVFLRRNNKQKCEMIISLQYCIMRGNSIKNRLNLLFSNTKPILYNINAHSKFDENPLIFIKVII